MLAPLNTSVSKSAWPSTLSLPSPGFQTKMSLPEPRAAVSLPRPPPDRVITVSAEQQVRPVAADHGVVAGAAVEREVDESGQAIAGGDGVVACGRTDPRPLQRC